MAQQQDNQKDQSRQAGQSAGQPDRSFGSQQKTETNTGMDKSRSSRSEDATQGDEELESGKTSRDTSRDASGGASRDTMKSDSQTRQDAPKKAY